MKVSFKLGETELILVGGTTHFYGFHDYIKLTTPKSLCPTWILLTLGSMSICLYPVTHLELPVSFSHVLSEPSSSSYILVLNNGLPSPAHITPCQTAGRVFPPQAPTHALLMGFTGAWGGKKHQCTFICSISAVILPTPSSRPVNLLPSLDLLPFRLALVSLTQRSFAT